MVGAGNALGLSRALKRQADHAAQGVLGELLIMHLVDRGSLIRHRRLKKGERATVTRPRRATEDAESPAAKEFRCRDKRRDSVARLLRKWGTSVARRPPGPA
ncbi:hypothetical protein BDI01nite_21170 [Brevundimonas diminuta]|nr:hypothetical protein BDI01nite_21170 [Brevundimonas diminuta]